MPVIGIESILCKNLSAFKPLVLHNHPVIVDAQDFLQYYRPIDRMLWLFGGEYLSMAVLWNNILDQFRQCDIDPLFIIGTDVERRGQQLKYQLKGAEYVLGCLQSLHHGSINRVPDELHLPLAYATLFDLLDTSDMNHICSPFPTQISCASLTHRMKCSLIASSPEYLLLSCNLEHRDYSGFDLIPLQCLNPIPFAMDKTRSKFALSAHKFEVNRSPLVSVVSHYRPLLFGLLGSDLVPRIRLPRFLNEKVHKTSNFNAGEDYKTRRWTVLVNWLKQFPSASLIPIRELKDCYSSDEVDNFWRVMTDCLSANLPDVTVGCRLSSFLLNTPSNANHAEVTEKNPVVCSGEMKNECWSRQFEQMFFASSKISNRTDFTARWPKSLLRLFHQSQLSNLVMIPLYSDDSTMVLPQTIEFLQIESSVWDASVNIRLVHYGILAKQFGNLRYKNKRRFREIVRRGSKLHCVTYQIKPFNIHASFTSLQQFCTHFFGLSLHNVNSFSDPLISLVVSLALWQLFRLKTSNEKQSVVLSPDCSPTILAILLCAVANHFNFEKLDQELVEHYDRVCVSAQELAMNAKAVNGSSESKKQLVHPEYIHSFNSIQIIYSLMRSLIALLCDLVPTKMQSTKLLFGPPWKVFPSGRLVHWLIKCLWIQEFTSRRHVAIRDWLPRLMKKCIDTSLAASRLKQAAQLFNESLNLLSTILCSSSAAGGMKVESTSLPIDLIDSDSLKPFSLPVSEVSSSSTISPQNGQEPAPKVSEDVKTPHTGSKFNHVAHLKRDCVSTPENLGFQPKGGESKCRGGKHNSPAGYAARLRERLKMDS